MRGRRDIRFRMRRADWYGHWHHHGEHHHHETKPERLERLEEHRRDVEEYLADLSEKIRRLQQDDGSAQPVDNVTTSTEQS